MNDYSNEAIYQVQAAYFRVYDAGPGGVWQIGKYIYSIGARWPYIALSAAVVDDFGNLVEVS